MPIPTLEQSLVVYLANKQLEETTKRQYKQNILRCLADWLQLPITEISNRMCIERHKELSQTVSPHATSSGKAMANYVFRTLRAILNYSIVYWELDCRNPVEKFGRVGAWAKLADRDTHIQPDNLATWYRALLNLPTVDRDFFLVLLYTGCRRKEISHLEWGEVDFVNRMLHIPGSRTKNHRNHNIAMSPQVMAILLERQKHFKASRYVFSTPDDPAGAYGASRRSYERVERVVGFDCNPHALRRSFARIAKYQCGFARDTIKKCLNHASNDITDRYIGSDPEGLRKCFEVVAEYISSRIEGRKPYYKLSSSMVKSG